MAPVTAILSRCAMPGALLVVLAAGVSVASAQGTPPQRINHLVNYSVYGQQDRDRIHAWADYWCGRLERAEPVDVKEIKKNLLDPLTSPVRVDEPFRLAYTEAALPRLRRVIDGDDPHKAYNALQVVGSLGTIEALDLLLAHCDIDDESRTGIRLWAAKGFVLSVRERTLSTNDVNRGVRALQRAAERETKPLVLRRQFEAIDAVNNNVSRDAHLAVLDATVERMAGEESGPSGLMSSTIPALKLIRDRWLQLDGAAKQELGRELQPILCGVLTVARRHWDVAQTSPMKDDYGEAVELSENVLTVITVAANAPQTQMGRAWRDRDKPRFTTDHDRWMSILKRP